MQLTCPPSLTAAAVAMEKTKPVASSELTEQIYYLPNRTIGLLKLAVVSLMMALFFRHHRY